MSYVWGANGPSFEYPTCYRTENRFLTLRAAVLFLSALALLWLVLSEPAEVPAKAALLRAKVERGSWVPHAGFAVFLMLLATLDLLTASRQRKVWLAEGQPAPLIADLPLQVTGASPDAAALLQATLKGRVRASTLDGNYQRLLKAVSRHVSAASLALLEFLRARIAQLVFMAGLVVALALCWGTAMERPAMPLAALLLALMSAAYVVYSEWISARAPSPRVIGAVLAVVTVLGLGAAWFGARVPQVGMLKALNLAESAALLLLCFVVIDALALMAARGQIGEPQRGDVSESDASVALTIEPERLMQEIDNELVRRWVDGVPNRRYIRRSVFDERRDDALASIVVLEESQPTLPVGQRDRLPHLPMASRQWLLALSVLGLGLTAAGAALWVRMADAFLQDAATGWGSAAPALALILVGGYALRAGHLVWSRIAVDSKLFLISLDAATGEAEQLAKGAAMTLAVRVIRISSAFHAAAEHTLGSRRVLALAGDRGTAQEVAAQVKSFANRAQASAPGAAASPRRVAASKPAPASDSRRVDTPRFCPTCGTPVLHAARFCQHCGGMLATP